MIAFRKRHPSLCRSRFWREDVHWYGIGDKADLSNDSHSLAFCLHGASQDDDDIYVMINAYWENLEFQVQEGMAREWMRIIDTALASPDDFSERGEPLEALTYSAAPSSVVVPIGSSSRLLAVRHISRSSEAFTRCGFLLPRGNKWALRRW